MSGIAKRTRTLVASPDEPNSKLDDLVQSVRKIEADQTSFNKTVIENFNALKTEVDKLVAASSSTPNEGNGRKRKLEDNDESAESSSKKKDAPAEQKQVDPQEPIPAKNFILRHEFQIASDITDRLKINSPTEEHFGIPWSISIYRKDDHLALYLRCERPKGKWCIGINCNMEMIDKLGKRTKKTFVAEYGGSFDNPSWGWGSTLKWDDLVENYLINDKLLVGMQIQITNMTGVYKDNLRCFDQTMEESSAEGSSNKKDAPAEQKQIAPQEPLLAKSFVLKHDFQKVSGWAEGLRVFSQTEEHFGISWSIGMYHKENDLALYLRCERPEGKWCIGIKCRIGLMDKLGKGIENTFVVEYDGNNDKRSWGNKFLKWDDLIKNYLINDKLPVEMQVEITNMTGIYKDNLRCFDQTMEECSDIILIVKDQRFYLSKLYLASQSPYFKGMFLGKFQDARQTEIVLKGVDPDDFQNYLEGLYGESAIDETTIEGVLLVADMYDTPIITKKCEEFLVEKSNKSNKKKLELSVRYKLDKLQEACLANIKSTEDVRAVLSSNVREMDHSLTAILLEKAVSFN